MSNVIDHVGIRVGDLPASRAMYAAALAELGFAVLHEGEFEGDAHVLFGRGASDDFCIHSVGTEPGRDRVTTGAHIAFRAGGAASVARWHAAAVAHGATDIGSPGVRPEYSGNCYAAFVLDLDGNNVEAVFNAPDRPKPTARITHIAERTAWESAQASGTYSAPSLVSEGFIHCSTPWQVSRTAEANFSGRDDLVLLVIDPSRLEAPPVFENCEGGFEPFPHVYGEIPAAAVDVVWPLTWDVAAERFDLPDGYRA